jgi:hypothetical protein
MRVAEIIRQVLDILDQAEPQEQPEQPVEDMGYTDADIKRFQQIAGLTTDKQYSTTPNEQYADVDAVTTQAGADSWQGTKEPEDIRGTTFRIYPSKDRP